MEQMERKQGAIFFGVASSEGIEGPEVARPPSSSLPAPLNGFELAARVPASTCFAPCLPSHQSSSALQTHHSNGAPKST